VTTLAERQWFDSQYGPHRLDESRSAVKHLLAYGRGEIDEIDREMMNLIVASYDLQSLMFEMADQRFERGMMSRE
jgi:hypothetical protein